MHELHRERIKEKYGKEGFEKFEEHVVLEFVLFHVLPRIDTNPQGHRLLRGFGGLDRIFNASEEELQRIQGIGPKAAVLLKSIGGIMLFRFLMQELGGKEVSRLSMAAEYHMRNLPWGAVSVFGDGIVFDYLPQGDPRGLYCVLSEDLREHGVEPFAVIIKGDGSWDELKTELFGGGIRHVYQLIENELFPLE